MHQGQNKLLILHNGASLHFRKSLTFLASAPNKVGVSVLSTMSMEDLLFGSDLEDSEDEGKEVKENKAAEREAQLNELFGESPSEGEEEAEHRGEASESDKDEGDSGDEKEKERKVTNEEGEEEEDEEEGGEDDEHEEENEVRAFPH